MEQTERALMRDIKKKRFTLPEMIKESQESLENRQRILTRAVKKGEMEPAKAEHKIAIQEAIVQALTWVNDNYEKVRATAARAKQNATTQSEMNLGVTPSGKRTEGIPD